MLQIGGITPDEASGGRMMLDGSEYRLWEKPVLYEEVCFVHLTEREKYILDLITLGVSELKIMWLTGFSRARLTTITESLEEKLGTDDLAAAGALLRDHDRSNPISIGARLAEVELRVLTGASVVSPIVEGEHCGLRLILADGTMMNAWIYAHEEIDHPGHVVLQGVEEEIEEYEKLRELLADIHKVLDGPPTTPRLARHMLCNLVERATALIDDIDGHSDFEPDVDDEEESDRWLNPISLNPDYQREPIIVAVTVPEEADTDEDLKGEEYEDMPIASGQPISVQGPFHYQDLGGTNHPTSTGRLDTESGRASIRAEQPIAPNLAKETLRPKHTITGLPPGPRLRLARKMIADFDDFVEALNSDHDGTGWERLRDWVEGLTEELAKKSKHSRHHLSICQIIGDAYFKELMT